MELEKINKPINLFVEKVEEELNLSLDSLQKAKLKRLIIEFVRNILIAIAKA